ncbi:MAG: YadA-like family protein [Mesosutterella multiformis]|nr:YadA-like family protein [Mesosutterella multiformis]
MSTQKKYMGSSHFKNTAIAIAVASSFVMAQAWATPATNPPGDGAGIAIGSGSITDTYAQKQIAIGVKSKTVSDGSAPNDSAIAIGAGAHTYNELGRRVAAVSFGKQQADYTGGIAIGANTYAITTGTSIGQRDYVGAMGDINVSESNRDILQYAPGSTSLGSNAYAGGTLSTVLGAYNIATSGYNGTGGLNTLSYAAQNFGSTIVGTLNTNESATVPVGFFSTSYSGIANSTVGIANRTYNSNGALIFGAGNEITNSVVDISVSSTTQTASVNELAGKLRTAIHDDEGGATLAIGGGNTADYTQASQLIGVNNTLKGSSSSVSQYNALNGYKNTASNVNHVTVIGSENSVSDTTTAVVFGDKRTLNGADNSVIIGSSSNGTTTSVKNAVAIGTESNATVEGGVALGAGSVASTDKGKVGYDPGTKAASTNTDSTWVSTRAAVSIGDTANGITRQITGLAAGTADTDAVNVAQLKAVKGDASQAVTESKKHSSVVAGNNIKVTSQANAAGGTEYSVSTADNVSFSSVTVGAASISQAGIQAGSQKITNVAPGTISATSTDAVNGSQLYQTNQAVQQNSDDISKLYNRSAELNRKIHRAGAHAAALAALHPLDFDENHRVSASLGLGQYHSSGAAALGIFVRPTENFMVSLGGSIASGSDVMGNLGVHYRFGGDSVRVNKTELTQQVSTLTAENRDLSAKLASSNSKLEAATSKIDSLMERIHAIEAKLNMK